MGDVIFSVEDVSAFDVFPFWMFGVFYLIAVLLIMFPQLDQKWPFANFSFLKGRERINGIICLGFVSLIAIPHFFMTTTSLKSEQIVLLEKRCIIREVQYDGNVEGKQSGFLAMDHLSLRFDKNNYLPPAGLHGMNLLSNIRSKLVKDERYFICTYEDVILQIKSVE
jgi:hypothetical protein